MNDTRLQCQFEILNKELAHPRLVYEQEQRYSWLPLLLDIYHLVDTWVRIDCAFKEGEYQIACSKGCSHCCRSLTIPINGLEFSGLCWYVADVLQGESKNIIKKNLINHQEESGCPFLIEHVCMVYPMRPIACRQFFMLNNPCRENEKLWIDRREDIYSALDKEIGAQIEKKILLFYGIKCENQQVRAIQSGLLQEFEKPIVNYNWTQLGGRIG